MNSTTKITFHQFNDQTRNKLRQHFRQHHHFQPKKLNPHLVRELHHGWLLPILGQIDKYLWGRWNYWVQCQAVPYCALEQSKLEPMLAILEGRNPKYPPQFVIEQTLPAEPIPQIEWQYNSTVESMLEQTINVIPESGSWRSWSASTYLEYFLNWTLFGFGHPAYKHLPEEPSGCEGASMRLYQIFDLSLLLLFPEDYMGHLIPTICSKSTQQGSGFFPTPLVVSQLMTEMVNTSSFGRTATFYEPACGTGSIMLAQSNYCLCGIGQDINSLLLKACLFQFYLYAPWFACPIWWLGQTDLLLGNSLSVECPQSMNAQYWLNEWLDSTDTAPNSDIQLQYQQQSLEQMKTKGMVEISELPTEPAIQQLINKRKNPTFEQLSLFKLDTF